MKIYTVSHRAYRAGHGPGPGHQPGPRAWLLTPTGAYIDAEPGEFPREYRNQLDRHGVEKIGRLLESIACEYSAGKLVCLCFEASLADCHRSILADWLTATGQEVTERPRVT